VPDRELRAVADETMRRDHVARASETAAAGPTVEREPCDVVRSHPAPAFE
jgi:hypothetical protein